MEVLDIPDTEYALSAKNIKDILVKNGIFTKDLFVSVLTDIEKNKLPQKIHVSDVLNEFRPKIKVPKIIQALFYIPRIGYKYLRLKLDKSTIPGAGIGVFAVDEIPKGAKGIYKGILKTEDSANMIYSWCIKSYSSTTGETDDNDEPWYYVDGTDLKYSNWTSYVNCGIKEKDNNMECIQKYSTIFYKTIKNIKSKKELFIDYGPQYREVNLGMKGNY